MTAEIHELTPESRVLEGAAGTPVVLADGRGWLLADGGLLNDLDELRDRLDDQARLAGSVAMVDVAEAAVELLAANYEITAREAWRLVAVQGPEAGQALADAVSTALFGPRDGRRTYTSWAASALIANGIDPDRVPTALLPHVLAQLEFAKRCIPRSQYIESAEAGRRIAGIRARAIRAEPAPTLATEGA